MRPQVGRGVRTAAVLGVFLLAGLSVPAPLSAGSPPVFTSLSPDGGEVIPGGTSFPIAWNVTHEGDSLLYATITWTAGGVGGFLTKGKFPTGGASWLWPVPMWNMTDARVQVCVVAWDGSRGCRASALPFAITAAGRYVSLLNPTNMSMDVPLDTSIVIGFSDPVNTTEVLISVSPPIIATATWNPTNTSVTLDGGNLLYLCSVYTVSVQAPGFESSSWRFMTLCDNPAPAPWITRAVLAGTRLADLEVTWNASWDDGRPWGTMEYRVLLATAVFGPYEQVATIAATGAANYSYMCVGCGHNDTDLTPRFLKVRAMSTTYGAGDSYFAAKIASEARTGWNLVAVPLALANDSVGTVLQTVTWSAARVYRSSDGSDPWKVAYADRAGDLAAVGFGEGLWFNATVPGVFTIAGLMARLPTVTLRPGWNLVAYASFTPRAWNASLAAIPGVRSVEVYAPGQPPYDLRQVAPAEVLQLGEACWVWIDSGGGGTWVQV